MKKYIIGIAASLALCLASCAFARGDVMPQPVVKKGGIVIGAEAGYGQLNTLRPFDDLNNYENDASDSLGYVTGLGKYSHTIGGFAWGAHLGYAHQLADTGWLSNVLLGIEAGYKDLGSSTYKVKDVPTSANERLLFNSTFKGEYDTQAIDVLLTAHYFIWQGWNVFAKGGVAVLYSKYTFSADFANAAPGVILPKNLSEDNTSWNLRPEYELGTGYTFDFTPQVHMDIHVMYDHIFTEPAAGSSTDPMVDFTNVPGSNAVLGGIDLSFTPVV